eukprot:Blabericola_migrator_1__4749@NODE_24_length_21460_cov_93_666994_g21_i0_p1_GENE_NODE_24_length_21460_cov_93_666994_g21_i0NODE_24_length_21460_cov_93_666994_g21_i0_p1_ORF_typecomplete_len1859_score307_12Ank_2/PF12796_7/7_5e11Ank_2/PF12796_7/3_5e11Ank_2/PF12796_7/2_4e06Ank_2/PF12796_7/7_5e10Ank_4/PF13637_6/5_9e06Ank_4/PF13637_6/2_8e09Ank_4/PF13637_6/0_0042Ank_4/PF13637_6/5e05Ank_4/PF13637_6/1_8e10Ank_4/PF13637_6/2_6e02Ank_4/PF13637_6/91Ank_5/PF13857_6/2_4e06Ank_5/PF13857_6/0_22Ank_5/PF13857_6/4e09A
MTSRKSTTTDGSILSEGVGSIRPTFNRQIQGRLRAFDLETPVLMEGEGLSCVDLRREDISGLRILKLHHVLQSLGLNKAELYKLSSVKKFIATKAALGAVDDEVFVHFPRLEELDLRDNKLTKLPDLQCCKKLRVLKLDNNCFTELTGLPEIMTKLNEVSLSHNCIKEIAPEFFAAVPELQVLNLEGNLLVDLPSTAGECPVLTRVNLRANPTLKALPVELWQAKTIQEFSLDWYRYCAPPLPRRLTNEDLKEACECLSDRLKDYQQVYDALSKAGHAPTEYLIEPRGNDTHRIKNSVFPCFTLIILLSKRSVRVSAVDKAHRTRLHVAAGEGNSGVVESLLQASASPDVVDDHSFGPLLHAVRAESFNCANALLMAGASVDLGGGIFGSSLHVATVNTDVQIVSLLLRYGADPNFRDRDGNTPLHVLFSIFDSGGDRSIAIALLLLLKGAKCDAVGREGWAPIHLAARRNQVHAFYFISDCRAFRHRYQASLKAGLPIRRCLATEANFDIDLRGGSQSWTPLHLAAHAGLTRIVLQLINLGANVLRVNACFRTPRDVAAGQFETSKVLLMSEKQWLYWKVCKSRYEDPPPAESVSSVSSDEVGAASSSSESEDYDEITPAKRPRDDSSVSNEGRVMFRKTASLKLAKALLSPRKVQTNETVVVGRRMSKGLFTFAKVGGVTAEPLEEEFVNQNIASLATELACFIDPHVNELGRASTMVATKLIAEQEGTFTKGCIETYLKDPLALGDLKVNFSKIQPDTIKLRPTEPGFTGHNTRTLSPTSDTTNMAKAVSAVKGTTQPPLTARTIAKSTTTSVPLQGTHLEVPSIVTKKQSSSPVETTSSPPLRLFGAEDFDIAEPVRTIRLRNSSRVVSAPLRDNEDSEKKGCVSPASDPPVATSPHEVSYPPLLREKIQIPKLQCHTPPTRYRQLGTVGEVRTPRNKCPKGAHKLIRSFMKIAKAAATSSIDEADFQTLLDWRQSIEHLTPLSPDCETVLRSKADILISQVCYGSTEHWCRQLVNPDCAVQRLTFWTCQPALYELLAKVPKPLGPKMSAAPQVSSPRRSDGAILSLNGGKFPNHVSSTSLPVPRLMMMSDQLNRPSFLSFPATSSFISEFLLSLAALDLQDLFMYALSHLHAKNRSALSTDTNVFGEKFLHKLLTLPIDPVSIALYVHYYLEYCPLTVVQLDAGNPADGDRAAIHIAVKRGLLRVVQLLLFRGCDPNIRDKFGSTPVHVAVWFHQPACLLPLLYHPKVDLTLEDYAGLNVMAMAVESSSPQCLAMLINRGAPVALYASVPRYGKDAHSLMRKSPRHVNDLDLHVSNIADRRLSQFFRRLLMLNGLQSSDLKPEQIKAIQRLLKSSRNGVKINEVVEQLEDPTAGNPLPIYTMLGQPLGQAVAQRVGGSRTSATQNSLVIARAPVAGSPTERFHLDEFGFPPAGTTSRCVFGENLHSVCLICSDHFWRVSASLSDPPTARPPETPVRKSKGGTTDSSSGSDPKLATTWCRNCSVPLCSSCAVQVQRLAAAAFPFLEDLPRFGVFILQSLMKGGARPPRVRQEGTFCAPPNRSTGDEVSRGTSFLSCGVARRYSLAATARLQDGVISRLLCVVDKTADTLPPALSDQAIDRAISSAPKDVLAVLALGRQSPKKGGIEWDDVTSGEASPTSLFNSPRDSEPVDPLGTLEQWSEHVLGIKSSFKRLALHLSAGGLPPVHRLIPRLTPIDLTKKASAFDQEDPSTSDQSGSVFLMGLCTPRMGAVRPPQFPDLLASPGTSSLMPSASMLQGVFAASELLLGDSTSKASQTLSGVLEARRLATATETLTLCEVCACYFSTLPIQYHLKVCLQSSQRSSSLTAAVRTARH